MGNIERALKNATKVKSLKQDKLTELNDSKRIY